MTDYLNNSNRTTLLFKKFQNKIQAGIDTGTGGTTFFNESKNSLNNIYNTDIFIENIERNLPDEYKLSSLDACGNIPGSIWKTTISDQDYSDSSFCIPDTNLIFYKEIYLSPVSGTNNAWWFIPEGLEPLTDNNLLKDMIPFNFNPIILGTFLPIVKYWDKNKNKWISEDQNIKEGLNWLIDYSSGILQFYQDDSVLNDDRNIIYDSHLEYNRPRISFIKYVGKKGLENFSGGDSINGNITILQGNVSNIFANITTMKLDISNNIGNISTLQGNVSNIFANITTMKLDISNNKGNISTLQGNVSNIFANITTMKLDISNNKGNISANITTMKLEISNNKDNISNLQTAVSTNTSNISNNKDTISTLQGGVNTNSSKITSLEGKINQPVNTTSDVIFNKLTITNELKINFVNGLNNVSMKVQSNIKLFIETSDTTIYTRFKPNTDAAYDLGALSYRWRSLYAWNSVIRTSDDRHKMNERPINNALGLLQQLKLYEYEKVKTMNGTDVAGTERGVLAQDVLNTELAYAVYGGGTEEVEHRDDDGNTTKETVEVAYSVKYDDLFVTAVQAVKELDAIVQAQQSKIDSLEAENTLMKSKLNELLAEAGKETI